MRQLIVTADDFGITTSVNNGIARAYADGIVSYLNLLPSGDAFAEAVSLAREMDIHEAGAHLSLTETKPVSGTSAATNLVDKDGRFCRNHKVLLTRLFLGRIREREVYDELRAQLAAAVNTGIRITCLSGHEHIHMVPRLLKIFIRLAKDYRIPSIRYPHGDRPLTKFDIAGIYRKAVLGFLSSGMKKELDRSRISTTDHFAGLVGAGRMDETTILDILQNLKDGMTELVTHPGFLGEDVLKRYAFHENCGRELAALTSVKVRRFAKESGISLVGFSAIPPKR
jgi:predicted glycoside hydrolase/deacetylase ChbG (UPF0249 family)